MTGIALVGSESTHARVYVRLFNVENVVPGLRISALCPEDPEQGRELCALGAITRTASDPARLADCAGALVVHRDAAHHPGAALPFLRAGLPVFVDKPFAPGVAEGAGLLATAAAHQAPVTSFSVMTMQQAWTGRLLPAIRALGPLHSLRIEAPGDAASPWGGILFYGIHATELLHAAAPGRAHSMRARPEGGDGGARLDFEGDLGAFRATVHLRPGHGHGYRVEAAGPAGTMSGVLQLDDDPYLTAALELGRFLLRRSAGRSSADILGPLALIEAARASLATGRHVPVSRHGALHG